MYSAELAQWARDGAVDLHYAFSREPNHAGAAGCKYVQDRIEAEWEAVSELWKSEGRVYLCGSPGMVEGIKKTARKMIQEDHKDLSPEQIEGFFKSMRNERIAVDVFA